MIFANTYGCRVHTPDSNTAGECTCTVFTARKRPRNINVHQVEMKTGETVEAAVIRYRGHKITWYEQKLPGPWHHCPECGQSYRALTVRANKQTNIRYKEMCLPCYENYYDGCDGPDGSDYEFSKKIGDLSKLRKKWQQMKDYRKANRAQRKAEEYKLKVQGYARNTAKRMAKEKQDD